MTLLETLVVVAIAMLVGGVAFPEMRAARDTARFNAAAALLAADLRAARGAAVRGGGGGALAPAGDGASYAWGGGARLLEDGARIVGEPIRFGADGSSSGGVIELTADGRRFRLAVDPATGLARRVR